jgi:hypothetical protein
VEAAAAETENNAAAEAARAVAGQTGPALAAGTVDVLLFWCSLNFILGQTFVQTAQS